MAPPHLLNRRGRGAEQDQIQRLMLNQNQVPDLSDCLFLLRVSAAVMWLSRQQGELLPRDSCEAGWPGWGGGWIGGRGVNSPKHLSCLGAPVVARPVHQVSAETNSQSTPLRGETLHFDLNSPGTLIKIIIIIIMIQMNA